MGKRKKRKLKDPRKIGIAGVKQSPLNLILNYDEMLIVSDILKGYPNFFKDKEEIKLKDHLLKRIKNIQKVTWK